MKPLLASLTLVIALSVADAAHAQNNNNLPFLRPQNGAQNQIPPGWPPGSGNMTTRPPSYSGSGAYSSPRSNFAPFQGGTLRGDRGNDRGIVGEPIPGVEPTEEEALRGTARSKLPKSGPQKKDDQEPRRENLVGRPQTVPDEEIIPKVIRLPKDERERKNVVFSLFKNSRGLKPPTQAETSLAIGSRLPASWVYMDVPETVARALPRYFGLVYTNVGGRYVVIDPATYRVVAIYSDLPS